MTSVESRAWFAPGFVLSATTYLCGCIVAVLPPSVGGWVNLSLRRMVFPKAQLFKSRRLVNDIHSIPASH